MPHYPTRRGFLHAAAATTLAAPYFVPARLLGQDAPSNKLTIGFIGTGNDGCNWIPAFLNEDRCRVIAVCDVNREGPGYWNNTVRGREYARKLINDFYKDDRCAAYDDFRDLIGREEIDAVFIATPDHWHALIAVTAARAGKHIYGEKPLALTVAEGRAMVDAVQKAGIIWQTGSQQRSDANFRRACELVRNGRIGKLHTVRSGLPGGIPDYGKTADRTTIEPVPDGFNYDFWLGPAPEAPYCPARVGVNFRWIVDYSGGQLTDWGGHHPDIAQWGMDTERTGPVAIKNAKGRFAEHPIYNTAVEYYFECEYANGVTLIISDKERGGVTFEGTDGWVWADRGRHEASSEEILKSPIGEDEVHLYESNDHAKNFVDCVFSGNETVAPIEVAHRSITIAHLGNIALQTGRNLKWDPETEQIIGDEAANAMLRRDYRKPWTLEM